MKTVSDIGIYHIAIKKEELGIIIGCLTSSVEAWKARQDNPFYEFAKPYLPEMIQKEQSILDIMRGINPEYTAELDKNQADLKLRYEARKRELSST